MNVYLVGPRGSGKTTVGRALAGLLCWPFIDQDDLVAADAGMSIADIFASSGEPGFRRLESAVLARLADLSGRVVATGGGVVLSPQNRSLMKRSGFVVHLDAPPTLLAERVAHDPSSARSRPPLSGAPGLLAEMQSVCAERSPLYEDARHLVLSAGSPPGDIAAAVAAALRERGLL
ncbi:MAG: shikimate kinase [Planctomycetes bacterium]|nr:shikimate kinase [Planctomycetota bacterium]